MFCENTLSVFIVFSECNGGLTDKGNAKNNGINKHVFVATTGCVNFYTVLPQDFTVCDSAGEQANTHQIITARGELRLSEIHVDF
ncbi:hypothetical protein NMYAN_150031 [Nitrosomonas nitrosa]|uniref:Uncharacterized protein n=1 Tax=Nitrosomonas nitrosa TaxID=52442 RepID=A0A8H9DAU1_9PROT|nr:hypothetical protein NMYAN_150031 [Nitrosomonas nitrosa]